MNDFLQSIRNGSYSKDNGNTAKPRYNNGNNQRPRRVYDQSQNGNFMRNGNERKFRPRTGNESFGSEDTMTTIKDTLTAILTTQETSLAYAERRAIAEERKANAFEFIARHIGKLTGESFSPVMNTMNADLSNDTDLEAPVDHEFVRETTPDLFSTSSKSKMNKDEVLDIIARMRREGATYNEIASHLSDLSLPTFSGRGKWHAQTIHRLCQTV